MKRTSQQTRRACDGPGSFIKRHRGPGRGRSYNQTGYETMQRRTDVVNNARRSTAEAVCMSAFSDSTGHCVAEIVNTFSPALSRGPLCNTTLFRRRLLTRSLTEGAQTATPGGYRASVSGSRCRRAAESNRRARANAAVLRTTTVAADIVTSYLERHKHSQYSDHVTSRYLS